MIKTLQGDTFCSCEIVRGPAGWLEITGIIQHNSYDMCLRSRIPAKHLPAIRSYLALVSVPHGWLSVRFCSNRKTRSFPRLSRPDTTLPPPPRSFCTGCSRSFVRTVLSTTPSCCPCCLSSTASAAKSSLSGSMHLLGAHPVSASRRLVCGPRAERRGLLAVLERLLPRLRPLEGGAGTGTEAAGEADRKWTQTPFSLAWTHRQGRG